MGPRAVGACIGLGVVGAQAEVPVPLERRLVALAEVEVRRTALSEIRLESWVELR
jgi:hypothetical protein